MMMGPSKRIIQRTSKNSLKDSIKADGVVDLTEEDSYCKSKSNLLSVRPRQRKGTTAVAKTGETDVQHQGQVESYLQNGSYKGKEKGPRNTSNNVPSSSKEKDIRVGEETDQKNDSILGLDEDLLPDSQFNSQDNLLLDSSQDGDQCEVRWDYTSPETMKQLKKMRGKYCAQDVKRIIANFPDVPIKPIPSSVHQYRYTLVQKHNDVLPEKNKVQKAKQRAAKRMQRREKCRGAVEDMILLLQQHQQKQEKTEAGASPLEVSAEKNETALQTLDAKASEIDDNSSEDDLFQDDNSFLIEATQNLEKMLPMVTKDTNTNQVPNSDTHISDELSDLLNTNSCDMFSSVLPSQSSTHSLSSKSVIPPSYTGALDKKLFVASAKPLSYNKNSSHKLVPQSTTGSKGFNGKYSNMNMPTSNVLCKGSTTITQVGLDPVINKQIGNKQGGNMCNVLGSSQNQTFGHHKFQGKKFSKQNAEVKRQSLSSPLRKCLSFDDSLSSIRKSQFSDSKNKNSLNISFDSSLTDELLLQATEVLDSVCDQTIDTPKNNSNSVSTDKTSLQCDLRSTSVSKSGCSNTPHRDMNITNTLLSPVKPLKQDAIMSRLQQSKASNSPVQSFFKKTFALDSHQAAKHKSPTGPHSTSTPVKIAKTNSKRNEMCTSDKSQANNVTDSFMDDDSFMNDEALFESQILPILELAETQVNEKESNAPIVSTKYSPDEIEKKRQAALQKLKKNECSHFPTENNVRVTSPEVIEHSQMSSSPRKCSQEEISRKKQAAQRKLLAKTNSTGSIQVSSFCPTSLVEPQNNNKVVQNEIKCTQEVIQMKREEALKKRRLRLMQPPNRKS